MNALLAQFLTETRETLDAIANNLMALESRPGDSELMTSLFRLVHTLKGNSGLFDFPEMTRVLHAAEDLMDQVREGKIDYSDLMANCLLDAMDYIGQLCDDIATGENVQTDLLAKSAQIAKNLSQFSSKPEESTSSPTDAETTFSWAHLPEIDPAWLQCLPAAMRTSLDQLLNDGCEVVWLKYSPETDCFFQGTDPLHQSNQSPGLLWGRMTVRAPWPELAALDAYRCELDFDILSTAPLDQLRTHFRYVSEQLQWFRCPARKKISNAQFSPSVLSELLQTQRTILSQPDNVAWLAGRIRAVAKTLAACLSASEKSAELESLEQATEAAIDSASSRLLRDWMDQHFCLEDTVHAFVPVSVAAPVSVPSPVAVPVHPSTPVETKTSRAGEEGASSKTLRVDQSKIERLMNLIGEMVVAKNAIPYLAARAENVYQNRELSREIKAQYGVINRIAEEMQDAIMQMRMLPVSFVFQRFPRLVRDLSQRLGKHVNLVLEGEETSADKNMIEALGDPLIHIVRNCLDHGFEIPSERLAQGKSEYGTLKISAHQQSDRVLIEISDDGRGIDPVVVKRKALQKGIIDEATMERMSDQEAINLVFAAGFSTAETVSDLSGRGVGMDVVRTAVERVNGSIALSSVKGDGTKIALSLPLSMAVTNVMTIESHGQMFGVPMDLVLETVRIPTQDLRWIKQSLTTVLRERVIPLRSLNSLLGIPDEPRRNNDNELAALVVKIRNEPVGILIDDFHDTTDIVMKSLPGLLSQMQSYSGYALMGDGTVLMVLNLREML